MKTPLLVLLTVLLLMIATRCIFAQDPMAQWKPSKGDKFVYFDSSIDGTYWNGFPYTVNRMTDTLTMEILTVDSAYSDSYQHVVTVQNSFTGSKNTFETFYYYHPGRDSLSLHPFAIDAGSKLCPGCQMNTYDFSIATTRQVVFRSDTIDLYVFAHDTNNGDPNGTNRIAAEYSKAFRWFYSQSSFSSATQDQSYSYQSEGVLKLITATVRSAVQEHPAGKHSSMSIQQNEYYLEITLHEEVGGPFTITLRDPLGRPVRGWQLNAGDAERQITLNIADIPTGIYFLMLEAPQKKEVRKLAIIR
ncbi:MAG TPA: hypothetical protein VFO76_04085 [Candidatus Kapabacteria bacterium]|nr:hypothetical protein [Candidatus Kapabacteria bacterium]